MKRIVVVCFVILSFLTGCKQRSSIIEHPAPDLVMDQSYFTAQGCFSEITCTPEGFQQPDPPITMISKPSDLLGGLTPQLPMAVGSSMLSRDQGEIPAVYVKQCMLGQYVRYLVKVNDETVLLDSIKGMAALFAPIDTEEEALSYAIAATGYSALYNLETVEKPVIYKQPLEESYVQAVDGGFLVHLFDTYLCGCGPHITRSIDFTVFQDGSIQSGELVDAFSDPQYDGLCID